MNGPVTVAVDANGADLGPAEVAKGAAQAAAAGTRVLLFGPAAELGTPGEGVEIVDAPVSIAKEPDPARAVRRTPDASIVRAAEAVAEGRADALVSGGSTGAALAAALFRFKRAPGVHRPALAIVVPVPKAPFLLLDAGANVEVRPEHLVQFAHMGAAFMEVVMGVERPRVALLSNGEEPSKGAEERRRRARRAARAPRRAELHRQRRGLRDRHRRRRRDRRRRLLRQRHAEGHGRARRPRCSARSAARRCRRPARSSAGCCCGRPCASLRDEIDPQEQGGAVLLGLRKLGVVPHGSFGARGFARAIEVAARGVRLDVAGRTHDRLAGAGALRVSEPAATVPDQS